MFVLEMRYPKPEGLGYDVAATLRISEGRAMVSGDRKKLMTHLDGQDADGRRYPFAQDPLAWGRTIGNRLRSGRITAVVIADPDGPKPESIPIDRAQAAAAAGLAPSTWSSMVSRGTAPAPLPDSSPARWDLHEVRTWAWEREQAKAGGTSRMEFK